MEQGWEMARELGTTLRLGYGVAPDTPVAVSELKRTQQTARGAGFDKLSVYPALNEVAHGVPLPGLREMLDRQQLPEVALETAEAILADPPAETIWITHGLVIAGLCRVLGDERYERFIPRFCEIRQLSL